MGPRSTGHWDAMTCRILESVLSGRSVIYKLSSLSIFIPQMGRVQSAMPGIDGIGG